MPGREITPSASGSTPVNPSSKLKRRPRNYPTAPVTGADLSSVSPKKNTLPITSDELVIQNPARKRGAKSPSRKPKSWYTLRNVLMLGAVTNPLAYMAIGKFQTGALPFTNIAPGSFKGSSNWPGNIVVLASTTQNGFTLQKPVNILGIPGLPYPGQNFYTDVLWKELAKPDTHSLGQAHTTLSHKGFRGGHYQKQRPVSSMEFPEPGQSVDAFSTKRNPFGKYALFVTGKNSSPRRVKNFKEKITQKFGIPSEQSVLMINPTRAELWEKMEEMNSAIRAKNMSSSDFLFNFLGHAGAGGGTKKPEGEDEGVFLLKDGLVFKEHLAPQVEKFPKKTRVTLLLDGCGIGSFTKLRK